MVCVDDLVQDNKTRMSIWTDRRGEKGASHCSAAGVDQRQGRSSREAHYWRNA